MSWVETLIGAGIGAGAGIFSAHQAQRFSERMSSTAHQREVQDLRKAGLNPMLSANRGASAPQGAVADVAGGAQRGASTALAAQAQRAQIGLIKAQEDATTAQAAYTRNLSADLTTQGVSGKYQLLRSQADLTRAQAQLASMTQSDQAELVKFSLERAKEEVKLTTSNVKQAEARTALLELAKEGQINIAEWEKRVGETGPAVKFFIELVRLMGQSRGITP